VPAALAAHLLLAAHLPPAAHLHQVLEAASLVFLWDLLLPDSAVGHLAPGSRADLLPDLEACHLLEHEVVHKWKGVLVVFWWEREERARRQRGYSFC